VPSTALVAVIGAHSNRTENSRLTREYIGALQVDTWNMRSEHKSEDREITRKVATSRFIQHRSTTAEIDAYMDKHIVDKANYFQPVTAGNRLRDLQIQP
jgi:hypothetical protein